MDYKLPAVADYVAEVLQRLQVSRAVVLGWSMGGHIAIEMMARHTYLVAGVLLTGTPATGRGPLASLRAFHFRLDMLLGFKLKLTGSDAERFARLCYGEETTGKLVEALLASDGRARAEMGRSVRRNDGGIQREIIESSAIPVAVVSGEMDPLVRTDYVERLAYANLWSGRCHTIAGAGHAPFLYAPDAFNRLLGQFASDMSAREVQQPQELRHLKRA